MSDTPRSVRDALDAACRARAAAREAHLEAAVLEAIRTGKEQRVEFREGYGGVATVYTIPAGVKGLQ